MDAFVVACTRAIARNKFTCTFRSKTSAAYNVETGTTGVSFEDTADVPMFPKHEQATQYHYPDLIGKELIRFYIPYASLDENKVKIRDLIVYDSKTYDIDSFQIHSARGQKILYRILAAKV